MNRNCTRFFRKTKSKIIHKVENNVFEYIYIYSKYNSHTYFAYSM